MDRKRINRTSLALLGLGLGGALIIYLTARAARVDPLLGDLMTRKKYLHELRLMGGNANVVMAEFTLWFQGLWQGKALAGTVAVLTVLVTLAFRWIAARPDIYAAGPAVEPKAYEYPRKPGPGPDRTLL